MLDPAFARRMRGTFGPAGAAWLEELPALIALFARRWDLAVGPPFPGLSYNYVAPARRADGRRLVLKLGVPRAELATEIDALRLYDGAGAARLVAADAGRGALLIERLEPGAMLDTLADDAQATAIAASVMRQIRRAPPEGHRFPHVADWIAGLARLRPHFGGGTGPLPAALVDRAEGRFAELLADAAAPVVLHGDLHHFNILHAGAGRWLAIDPKGVLGEPAYEAGALLRNPMPAIARAPGLRRTLTRRAHQLADELGLDRERILGWAFAQALLAAWWSCEEGDLSGLPGWLAITEALR